MLRLSLTRQPEWLTLLPGVRVLLRPMCTAIFIRAQVSPGVAEAGDAGSYSAALTTAIAAAAIIEWEGVFDADWTGNSPDESGPPLAVTPDAVAALLDVYAAYQAFSAGYVAPWLAVDAEKNGSAPSLNGTSAAAQTIAVPATASAPPAHD